MKKTTNPNETKVALYREVEHRARGTVELVLEDTTVEEILNTRKRFFI